MQVGMLHIGVTHDEVLCIGNLYALHILPRQIKHQLIRYPQGIVRAQRQQDVFDAPFDIGVW